MSGTKVLVDYDNLSREDRSRGVLYCLERIADVILSGLDRPSRLEFRLYGGWASEIGTLTTSAQAIAAKLPVRGWLFSGVPMTATLAHAPVEAANHLYHGTFRTGTLSSRLRMKSPSKLCQTPACGLMSVAACVNNDRCSQAGCQLSASDFFVLEYQKMVDTMMCMDIVYLSRDVHAVAVVSGDDDLWPAIHTSLLRNAKVTHIYTKSDPPLMAAREVGRFRGAYSLVSLDKVRQA